MVAPRRGEFSVGMSQGRRRPLRASDGKPTMREALPLPLNNVNCSRWMRSAKTDLIVSMKIRTSHVLLALALVAGVVCAVFLAVRSRQSASGNILEKKITALLAEPSTRSLLAPLAMPATKQNGSQLHRSTLQRAYFSKATFEEYYRKRLVETGTAPDAMEATVQLIVGDSMAAQEMDRCLGPLTSDGIMMACLGQRTNYSGTEVRGHLWMVYRFAALHDTGIEPLKR